MSNLDELLIAYTALIIFIFTFIVAIVHGVKYHSDLCTKERDVLDFRREKPDITLEYTRLANLTYAQLIFCALILFAETIQFNFTTGSCKSMIPLSILDKLGLAGSHCLTYLVLILRLFQIYGSTKKYAYNATKLKIIAYFTLIFYIIMFILMAVFEILYPIVVDDADTSFPYFCQIIWGSKPNATLDDSDPLLLLVLGVFVLYDLIASVAAVFFFLKPLLQLKADCKKYDEMKDKSPKDNTKSDYLHRLMYHGYKFFILVTITTMMTIIWILMAIAGKKALATFVGQADFFISSLCLILMTPYYPNGRYFERLCCVCIACCDPKRNHYQGRASAQTDSYDIDMALQVKLLAEEKGIDYDDIENAAKDVAQQIDNNVTDVTEEDQNL